MKPSLEPAKNPPSAQSESPGRKTSFLVPGTLDPRCRAIGPVAERPGNVGAFCVPTAGRTSVGSTGAILNAHLKTWPSFKSFHRRCSSTHSSTRVSARRGPPLSRSGIECPNASRFPADDHIWSASTTGNSPERPRHTRGQVRRDDRRAVRPSLCLDSFQVKVPPQVVDAPVPTFAVMACHPDLAPYHVIPSPSVTN